MTMRTRRYHWGLIRGGLLAGAIALAGTLPAHVQAQEYDARWLPWLGCWEPATGPESNDGPMVCMQPVADGVGVEMLTVTDGGITSREAIRADGRERRTSREGCDGWQRTSFSDDGQRVYLQAEFICEGGVERSSAGLMSMARPYEWLDVRTVDVAGESVPWVLRYQLAAVEAVEAAGLGDIAADRIMAQESARIAAASALTIDDVIDASNHINAKAVEAWIVERDDVFTLDASRLTRMADAGVAASVIDMIVAVSYPEHFVVNRGAEGSAEVSESQRSEADHYRPGTRGRYGYGRYYDSSYYDPFFLSPFYSPYAGFGYYSPYRYGFGYGLGYGGYGFGFGTYGTYRPTIVVAGRRQPESLESSRAVRGRGYTRGLGGGSSGSGMTSRGSSSGAAAAPSRGSSSSGSQGSGRRAQRRGR